MPETGNILSRSSCVSSRESLLNFFERTRARHSLDILRISFSYRQQSLLTESARQENERGDELNVEVEYSSSIAAAFVPRYKMYFSFLSLTLASAAS